MWEVGRIRVFVVAVPVVFCRTLGAVEVETIDGCGVVSACGKSSEINIPPPLMFVMNSKCAFVDYQFLVLAIVQPLES
jgi:hypothetical protein